VIDLGAAPHADASLPTAVSVQVIEAAEVAPPRAAAQIASHIRTFHPRRGRMGATRSDAFERLWPTRGLEIVPGGPCLDQVALFGRRAPLVLEIGCGMGEATAAMAAADPDRDYLAADVHTPGLANLLALAENRGLANIRAARGDAIELLRDLVAPGSLDAVHVYFPDPWPKAKHHKRRLVRPDAVALIRNTLRLGGLLRSATDWEPYAQQMLEVLSADTGLRNLYAGFAPDAGPRPLAKFERRALASGRPVFDLVFRRA
jgi:tRNA (guanine-N7-)-methyltransferase